MGARPAEPSPGRLLPVRAAPYLTTPPPRLAPRLCPGDFARGSGGGGSGTGVVRVESHKPLKAFRLGGRREGEVGVTSFQ